MTRGGTERMEANMHETHSSKASTTMTAQRVQLCRRCGFHPASLRIEGYCSWDCHDADDDADEDEAADEAADEIDDGDGDRAA
jgi:hypothetical protein